MRFSKYISFAVLPIRRHAFFEQTVLQGQIGDHLLERRGLTPQIVGLVRGGGPGCIASQALLSSLQEVLRPAIVQVLRDPLAATQLGNAVLAAQAFQNDPDLLLGRIVLARRPSDVLDNLLSRFLQWSGLLSHLRSYERYDEPETLPYSIRPFCPMSADGGHQRPLRLEAATLSRMRSEVTSRSNCANDSRTLSVNRPIEVVVLNCCVTETKDAPR